MEENKPKVERTPCGYAAGPLKASDGTVYEVLKTGQIVREGQKMGKAQRKRHKRERRQQRVKA